MHAHLLEFRLFFDEPGLVWRAQVDLLRDNARLVRQLLVPTLLLGLPMTWLFLQLEAVYGHRNFHPGEAGIVTAQLSRPIETTDRFDLQSTPGIAVETPPIRVFHQNQVSWRIRAASDVQAAVDLTMNGRTIRKSVAAVILSPTEELRLPEGDIAWVKINYPEAHRGWSLWFLAVATASALLSTRRQYTSKEAALR